MMSGRAVHNDEAHRTARPVNELPEPRAARGYSWPPFEPGHELSIRHGAFSSRRVDPLASELIAGLLAERSDLTRYPESVAAWARAEARCLLLDDWIAEHGILDQTGAGTVALRYVAQFERLAMELRARLGLDPRSEAELARDRSQVERNVVDLDALRARGAAILESRHRSGSAP
jgi:hypothetical protein